MATKAVDVYMKYCGITYLRKILQDPIKSIIAKKISCEVDPSRLDKGDDLKKNKKNLLDWNRKIVEAIFDAKGHMPV